jgi:hypothetical protein
MEFVDMSTMSSVDAPIAETGRDRELMPSAPRRRTWSSDWGQRGAAWLPEYRWIDVCKSELGGQSELRS